MFILEENWNKKVYFFHFKFNNFFIKQLEYENKNNHIEGIIDLSNYSPDSSKKIDWNEISDLKQIGSGS